MNIYFPLIGAKYHGGVRVLFQISNKLSKEGYKCYVIAPDFAWNPLYKVNSSVNIHLIKSKNLIDYFLKLIFFIRRANSKSKENLWILSHWITGIISYLSKNKGKTLFLVQDSEEVFYPKKSLYGKILRSLVFFSYKNSSKKFVVTTKYGYRKLKAILKNTNSKIYFSPLGVDKTIFYVNEKIKKKKQILFFPRKGYFKGFDLLLDIFSKLYTDKDMNDFEFVFVSQETELFSKIKKLSQNDKRVKCFSVNNDKKLSKIYNESLLLIHTSRYEGICLPILEALSCGTFVVTTNSFGPLTYLSKENSRVFVSRNSNLIYKEILKIIKDKQIYKSEEISLSVKDYNIKNFLENFAKILKEIE